MKILHLCLSCFYIDNYNYQENVLPRQNKNDNHEVLIIASTETFISNNKLGYIQPSNYINEDGIRVKRLPYKRLIPNFLARKIRTYEKLDQILHEYKPDVILFHGTAAFDILKVAKYKEKNPSVKLYVDSHEDFNNSAQNFVSKQLLHRLFYKNLVHKALPYIDKILCISTESVDFMKEFYKIPLEKLEFYPLGGTIIDGEEYQKRRERVRKEHGLKDTDILFVHSGKMGKQKRTSELLQAFREVGSGNFNLFLLGNIPEETKDEIIPLIEKDKRVKYLGWKNTEELQDYLCAADMYLQPGSQSATMQNSLCCGCSVMLYPHKSHEPFLSGNGFFVKTTEDIIKCFKEIRDNPLSLKTMSQESYKISYQLLDYKKLASRITR